MLFSCEYMLDVDEVEARAAARVANAEVLWGVKADIELPIRTRRRS